MLYGQIERFEDALRFFAEASAVQPSNFIALFNQGKALQELHRHEEALACYDSSLTLKPDFAEGYNNRGTALKDLQRYNDAIASYGQAIALRPNYVNAYNNRGAVLIKLRRYDEALVNQDKVLTLQPNFAKAHNNRAIVLFELKQYEEALISYERALALDPQFPYTLGARLHAQMRVGLWDDFEARVGAITQAIARGQLACHPFPLLALPVGPDIIQHCTSRVVADKYPPAPHTLYNGERYQHDRIRLGYFSADFHNHATAHLMAELFEKHDRSRFEVFAFSFGPSQQDAMRARLIKAFDHFFDVADSGDQDIAALARQHEIAIAVDLKGYTQDCRPGIFALRPAPIQVNYLGYPATMAAPYIDYIIADPVVIPEAHFPYYSEKVVHLPHSYQVNDSQRCIAEATPTRRELGLPEAGFVFCCFNNTFKITPDVFTIWMRLLSAVEDSVLWLFEDNAATRRHLGREAQNRGIDPQRLVFAPRMNLAEHLARQRRADLFLDTFYYNAHTTTSDALWAGLPVLTCLGNAFAGRVAASLLQAVGLPELITHSHDDYEALALKLATHPDSLATLKHRLDHQRLTQALFNSTLFNAHIENAYARMWQRHLQGAAPEHLRIPS
jgi:predicted O-linked N-acetylglucosamine transferase (SPINDLY family)